MDETIKVQLFWEGKLQNLEEDWTHFCGLLRKAELYMKLLFDILFKERFFFASQILESIDQSIMCFYFGMAVG